MSQISHQDVLNALANGTLVNYYHSGFRHRTTLVFDVPANYALVLELSDRASVSQQLVIQEIFALGIDAFWENLSSQNSALAENLSSSVNSRVSELVSSPDIKEYFSKG